MDGRDLLEPDALRSFAVFAEHRNFTTAAAVLHISQPSLHVKIRKLSAALGAELYERDGRRLTLTAAGERLAAFALDSRRRADEFLRELHQDTAPTVTIAAGRGALRWVIAEPIRQIGRQGRRVHVITTNRDGALSALTAGQADLAVIAHDPPGRQVEAVQIAAYRQVLVIDDGHPLATRRQIRLRDIDGLDLVVPPVGRAHRRALDRALLDADVTWQVAAEVDGWDLLVHLVALGVGATIVNGCVEVPDGLRAVPIHGLPKIRYWAAWRPQRQSLVRDLLDQFGHRP
ncbi:DNA-binding transcriptional regulator, LysR family [Micromonospora phaseoli]|uniref:DNA-binding transcriptional regulator, LysR family n=1 Tax=Micromonospora phaseoli TaxID=1144548 RepID=A0A1H7DUE9_9ACTN|nr:LysR family transcriptional regulator [Micromonospora phaseoli]PZV89500.1 DNA-binding transcriptional LysR family regulator [Micromonospora phaseoli]GIJ80586.1 LysR family transcriptional regulator [Micromonospora phaseoli]SEK03302.1 DNA-binding transcriptional regulator, LysR family [Micromonospora phaseoli]